MGEGAAKGFRRRSFFGRLASGLLAALGLGASRRSDGATIYLFPSSPHGWTVKDATGDSTTRQTWSWK